MQTLRKIFKKLNKFRGVVAPPSEPPYPALIGEKSSMISRTCVWHASCIRTGSARKTAPRADGAAFGTSLAYTRLTYLSVYAVGALRKQQKTACGARLRAYRGKTMNCSCRKARKERLWTVRRKGPLRAKNSLPPS